MLRSCLLSLLFYAALVFGYYLWLDRVFERPGSIYGALILGLVVLLCIGALLNARRALADWSLLAKAERGLPPRDGKVCAVAGKIYPVDQPLIAPFSGEECVLCEYDMSRHERHVGTTSQENTGSDFAGFLMVPAVVRGQHAELRVLGFPIVEGFRETVCNDYASARRAIDYLTTHEFESRTGVKIVTVLGVFEDVWSDEDGLVEKNIRLGTVSLPDLFPPELEAAIDREMQTAAEQAGPEAGRPAGDLLDREDERLDRMESLDSGDDEDLSEGDYDVEDEDDAFEDDDEDDFEDEDDDAASGSAAKIPRMTEKRIDVGTQVCVIGVYNEMKRGLAPPGRGRHPNRLFCGSAAKLTKVFRNKFQSHLIGGLVFLAIAHGAALAVMQVYQHSDATARDRASAAFEAADKQDFDRLSGLLRRGMDINIRNSSGATLLMEAKEPAVASWLIERGSDVNAKDSQGRTALMSAALANRPEVVRQLIAAKADLDVRDTEYNRTALMMADSREFDEIAAMLRQAGAKDDVITASTGEPLPEGGGEPLALVKEYLAAVHARDPSTLARLFVTGKNINFNDTDWDLWHSCRPVEIAEWTGFVRGDDASLTVGGVTGGGYMARWRYQLQRDAGQWKITREEDDR